MPLQFTYQGRLTDSNGVPVVGVVTAEFAIVKGGTALGGGETNHLERGVVVRPDVNGVFTHTLGATNPPIDLADIADGTTSNRYIAVSVGGQELLPRQPIVSVPFAIACESGNPAGTMLAYGGVTLPDGYLWCNGVSYGTNQYPRLYKAIGTAWGSTGAGFFNVPDTRGFFLRGVSTSASVDPDRNGRTASNPGGAVGNNVGSVQPDALQSHDHVYSSNGNSDYDRNGPDSYPGEDWNSPNNPRLRTTAGPSGRTSAETRPKNLYVNYIIKH